MQLKSGLPNAVIKARRLREGENFQEGQFILASFIKHLRRERRIHRVSVL